VPRVAKMVQWGKKISREADAPLLPIFVPMRGDVPNAAAVLQLFSKK